MPQSSGVKSRQGSEADSRLAADIAFLTQCSGADPGVQLSCCEKPYMIGFVLCVGEKPLKNPYFYKSVRPIAVFCNDMILLRVLLATCRPVLELGPFAHTYCMRRFHIRWRRS
jgi:hypothetical protein